jgi:hypothetical protein
MHLPSKSQGKGPAVRTRRSVRVRQLGQRTALNTERCTPLVINILGSRQSRSTNIQQAKLETYTMNAFTLCTAYATHSLAMTWQQHECHPQGSSLSYLVITRHVDCNDHNMTAI